MSISVLPSQADPRLQWVPVRSSGVIIRTGTIRPPMWGDVVAGDRYPSGAPVPQAADVAPIATGTGLRFLAYCHWGFPATEATPTEPRRAS
jgi:hypothetical protein